MWTGRSVPSDNPRYFYFTGRAYPVVATGKGTTNLVTSDLTDRQSFYYDPAIQLTDADLQSIKGTQGAPLCIEHQPHIVVGEVYQSWMGDRDGNSLKIIGRIDLHNGRGRQTAEEIKAGKWKGLSVGYHANLQHSNNGQSRVAGKLFNEISLVEQPFFPSCMLSPYNVTASKTAIKNSEDNMHSQPDRFYVPIQMSDNITQPGQAGQQQAAAPHHDPVPASELLQQTVNTTERMKEMEAEIAKFREKAKQDESELAVHRARQQKEDEEYAAKGKPEAEAFMQELCASGKIQLTEERKRGYYEAFCNPQFKSMAEQLRVQHEDRVELKASLKTERDRAAAAEEARKVAEAKFQQQQQDMSRSTQLLTYSRRDFAAPLSQKDLTEDERRGQKVDVTAGGAGDIPPNHIMIAPASAVEMPFIAEYGYGSGASVTASGGSDYTSYAMRQPRSVPAPRAHRMLVDNKGEPALPGSARHFGPSQAWFAMMCSNTELINGDLNQVTKIKYYENENGRKDQYEHASIAEKGMQMV